VYTSVRPFFFHLWLIYLSDLQIIDSSAFPSPVSPFIGPYVEHAKSGASSPLIRFVWASNASVPPKGIIIDLPALPLNDTPRQCWHYRQGRTISLAHQLWTITFVNAETCRILLSGKCCVTGREIVPMRCCSIPPQWSFIYLLVPVLLSRALIPKHSVFSFFFCEGCVVYNDARNITTCIKGK